MTISSLEQFAYSNDAWSECSSIAEEALLLRKRLQVLFAGSALIGRDIPLAVCFVVGKLCWSLWMIELIFHSLQDGEDESLEGSDTWRRLNGWRSKCDPGPQFPSDLEDERRALNLLAGRPIESGIDDD